MDKKIRRLHESGVLKVSDLQRDPSLMDGYPHQRVLLDGDLSLRFPFPALFWAVELLEGQGWEEVTWLEQTGHPPRVVMRRKRGSQGV